MAIDGLAWYFNCDPTPHRPLFNSVRITKSPLVPYRHLEYGGNTMTIWSIRWHNTNGLAWLRCDLLPLRLLFIDGRERDGDRWFPHLPLQLVQPLRSINACWLVICTWKKVDKIGEQKKSKPIAV